MAIRRQATDSSLCAPLREPLRLPCGVTLPNCVAKAAMTEGLADAAGRPSEALVQLYATWGHSGCGLHITGNVQVDARHLERPGNVILDRAPDAAMRKALTNWARATKAHGAHVWMQLNHAGRQTQAIVNPHPHAPSALALDMPGKQFGVPVALTARDIEVLVERFAAAAGHAQAAGFDGVQIHAAHGYLLSQFLSPRSNQRTDDWGGTLAHRARLLLDIVRATRQRVGSEFAVAVKLNSADFQKGGFGPADSMQVVDWLADAGVDLVEISGGNYEQPRMLDVAGREVPDTTGLPPSTAAREAYFADFAAQLRGRTAVPLMLTGGFRSADAMARAVRDDGIDMVGIARPLCVESQCIAQLLAGEIDALDRSETRLRLGPGWLGPHSPSSAIKMLNGFGAAYWYYQQLRRLGDGLPPDVGLGVGIALIRELMAQRRWLDEARQAGTL